MDLEALQQLTEQWIPFNRFLGVRVVSLQEGRVVLEIPFREELVGDPIKRALHGGVMSSLADVAGGMAIWSALPGDDHRLSTIDLRVDYLRPGRQETLMAEGVVVRAGRSVGVADIALFHPSAPSDKVATGKAVYAIKAAKPIVGPGR